MQNEDIRCGTCPRKLGVGKYTRLQIKCPRCGTLNHLRAASLPPERHRAPSDMTTDETNPQANAPGPRQERL